MIPPPPGAHTCRAGHMSVVTISAHAHASTHSDEALRQTSCIAVHHQSISQRVASYQLRRAPPHTTCSSRLPTSASVLRTFGSSWRFAVLTRNSPTGQHAPTWPQIRLNPAKPNGSKPSEPILRRLSSTVAQPTCVRSAIPAGSLPTEHRIKGNPEPVAAKSYTNPVSRSCCRIHIRKPHPLRYIGSRSGGFFCLSHQR